jgi:ethanolamine ammonia-lyase small subunit
VSATRAMIDRLRARIAAAVAMPPPPAVPVVPAPPVRVFAPRRSESRFAREAAAHTTALVGIGHVGTRYATDVVLQFQAELAVAHQAVAAELPPEWAESSGLVPVRSRVSDHREFLLRPDLGRRLDDESVATLADIARRQGPRDVVPILADGLSAVACLGSGLELVGALRTACEARGLTVGAPVGARFARVWLEDEIGQLLGAKVAVIVLGERPGLGTGDGLSAYVVYDPKLGNTDGDRNMISNIHARGTPPAAAADRLAALAAAMIEQKTSGVRLDLARVRGVVETGYRAPQVRERLVQGPRRAEATK